MRTKWIVLLGAGLLLALAAPSGWALTLNEDPDLPLDSDKGKKADDAEGTNLTGTASGVYEDFSIDGGPQLLENHAASLAVVLILRTGNDQAVFGKFLECSDPAVAACPDVCEGGLNGRIKRGATVATALCIEDLLGVEIGLTFGKSNAVLKSFSLPMETLDTSADGTLGAFWSADVEMSAK